MTNRQDSSTRGPAAPRKHLATFLGGFSALVLACLGTAVATNQDFLATPVLFDAHGDKTVVALSGGMTRRQAASIKLGYARQARHDVGLFGNHQVQYFGKDAFAPQAIDYYNYWYANLALPDLLDYLSWLSKADALPRKLAIVHITTPNNDNGMYIVDPSNELLSDIRGHYQRSRGDFSPSTLVDGVTEWTDEIQYYMDWKTVISSAITFAGARGQRAFVLDGGRCGDVAARRAAENLAPVKVLGAISLPRSLLEVVSPAYHLGRFCQGDNMLGYHADGSATFLERDALVIDENPLRQGAQALALGDEEVIARLMTTIADLITRHGAEPVFLIAPVYESRRPSSVDQIMDRALALAPSLKVIDHRGQFADPSYFVTYDHPNANYFRQVAVALRQRGLLPTLAAAKE